jgi:subfamily B ATP-binding cassette protein HlyB/CyaB
MTDKDGHSCGQDHGSSDEPGSQASAVQTGLVCLQIAAQIRNMRLDTRALSRSHAIGPGELEISTLIRIARDAGLKASLKRIPLSKLLTKYPLPIIFQSREKRYGLVLSFEKPKQKGLVLLPGEIKPREMALEELLSLCNGVSIVIGQALLSQEARFGFGWFFSEIVRHKNAVLQVMLASFFVQIFGLVTPLFTQVILDKVIVHRTLTTLDVMAVGFLLVSIFEFALNMVRNYVFVHAANKIDAKLGAKLFRHLLRLPFAYFENRKVGNIVARVRELDTIRDFITNKSVTLIIDLLFSFVFVVMMVLYSPMLTAIVLVSVALVGTIYVIVTPELRDRLQNKFNMAAESSSYLVECVTGVQTVKSLAIEGAVQNKWENALGNYLKASFKLSNMGNVAGAFCSLIQRAMTISVLYFGVRLVIENKLTIGQLIAFQMFAGQFTQPVLRLVNLWNDFQQALLSVDRLGDILHHPMEVQSSKSITLPAVGGAIQLKGVSFSYAPGRPKVLDDVSLEIPAGTSIGIVGRSGSGKSTVAKLIQRLYLPTDGAIFIDNVDSRHMDPLWLRSNIGVVPQESFLFNSTVRDNICDPLPAAPIELIIAASKVAGAHEFISEMPEGYDTMVGERGSSLSGGQKQRIAIARALISNPKILIFDEATSALDYESERIIQENLNEIKKGRTMIIIAHRLSTIRTCDKIVVVEKGHIVETGTHQELIQKNGIYASLNKQQSSIVQNPEQSSVSGAMNVQKG